MLQSRMHPKKKASASASLSASSAATSGFGTMGSTSSSAGSAASSGSDGYTFGNSRSSDGFANLGLSPTGYADYFVKSLHLGSLGGSESGSFGSVGLVASGTDCAGGASSGCGSKEAINGNAGGGIGNGIGSGGGTGGGGGASVGGGGGTGGGGGVGSVFYRSAWGGATSRSGNGIGGGSGTGGGVGTGGGGGVGSGGGGATAGSGTGVGGGSVAGGTGGVNIGHSGGRGVGDAAGGIAHIFGEIGGGGNGGDARGRGTGGGISGSVGGGGDGIGGNFGLDIWGAISSGDSGSRGLNGIHLGANGGMATDFSGARTSGGGDGSNLGSAASVGVGSGGFGINMGLDVAGGDMGMRGIPGGTVGNNGVGDGVGLDVVSINAGGGAGGSTGAKSDTGRGFDGASIGGGGFGDSAPFLGLDGVSGDIAGATSSFGGGSTGKSGGMGISGGTGVGSGDKAGKTGGGIGNMGLGIVHDGQYADREVVEISGGTSGKKVVYFKERDNEDNDKKYYVTTTIRSARGGGGSGGKGALDGTVSGGTSFGGVASIGVGLEGIGSGGISGGSDITALDMILRGRSGGGAGSALVNGIGGNVERISGSAGIGQYQSIKADVSGPSSRIDVGVPFHEIDVGGLSFDAIKLGVGRGIAEPAINNGVVKGSGTMFDVRNVGGGIAGGVDAVTGVIGSGTGNIIGTGNGCSSSVAPGCGGMISELGGGSGRGDGGLIGVGNIGRSGSGGGAGREGLDNLGTGRGSSDTHNFGGAGPGFKIVEGGGRSGGGVGAPGGFELDVGMHRVGGASSIGSDIGGFRNDGSQVIPGGGYGDIGGIDFPRGGGGTSFDGIRINEGFGGGVEAKYVPMGSDGIVFANLPQANIHGSITSGGPISISIPDIFIDPGKLQKMEGGSLSRTYPVTIGSGSSKSEVKVMVVVSVPVSDVAAFGGDGSIGASEGLGKVDFSFDQRSGSMMFDASKMFDSNMTTTTLSPLKVDIDKSKDDEKLKTKIKLQRGNGDLTRKAEIKVKQKLEDDEKVKIKIETNVPGLDGRKETEVKLEGEVGMNIKVPGMDVGLNIQESGVKVIDLAKPNGDKLIASSPTQVLGGGPGESVGGSIDGPGFGVPSMTYRGVGKADPSMGDPSSQLKNVIVSSPNQVFGGGTGDSVGGPIDGPGFGVPSMTDHGVGRADPSMGGRSSQLNSPSLPNMNVMQPDLNFAPSSPVLFGPDFGAPRSGSIDIGPVNNRPSTQAEFSSAAEIGSISVPKIDAGRDAGPGFAGILPGMDLLSTAVVAQPVPIVPDIAFGPVQGLPPGPDPLPVPAPNTASAYMPDTVPAIVPLPVPGSGPGLVSSVTATTIIDKKEKNENKDGSRLKSALQDLIKALQNIKSTKMDLLSFKPDPLAPATTEHSVVQTPALELKPLSAQVITSGPESALNQDFDGLCLGSIGTFVDGVGYAKYPGDCEKFLQCYYVGATVRPVIRKCPYGLFWDQALMLCRRPDDVFCPADPCFTGKKHYRRDGGCNCYYQCVNGVSTPKCCGSGFKYDDVNECVSDNVDKDKCDNQCEISDTVVQRLGSSTCNSMEDGSNIYGYINLEHGGLRFRACPFGTTYNPQECRCSARYSSSGSSLTVSKTRQRSCRSEFNMNFDDGFIDLSDGNTAFSFMGCSIDHGSVSFAGAGHMTLWGFTGRFYGTTFGIKTRIKPHVGSRKRSETIISNCGFDGEPTISICMENGKVKMTALVTGSSSPMVIEDLCDDDTWCDIVYYFNGKNFVGGVGKKRQSLPCGGILKSNGNPMMIGGCNNGPGFNGLIDDVNIYTKCIPDDF